MRIRHDRLSALTARIFTAAGCSASEAERVARHLVEANLVGHDSHGVIRIPAYVDFLRTGRVLANKKIRIVLENDAIAVVDGEFGLGQSVGEQAMELGIAKSSRHGIAVVALRNSGHLGRIGDWALQCARAGQISLHFVNTSGMGMLVAPYGGIDRRLSANPIAAGVPIKDAEPLILDISTCMIAEGKIRVARNQGARLPDHCIIDSEGRPTNDPNIFYADPPGAILPIAGHKGYGLALVAEVLAGALTGGSCTNPANARRLSNGMLSILFDRKFFLSEAEFDAEVARFVGFVKGSRTAAPGGEILMPGEVEERTRAQRLREGVDLDDATAGQIAQTARSLKVPFEDVLPVSADAAVSQQGVPPHERGRPS